MLFILLGLFLRNQVIEKKIKTHFVKTYHRFLKVLQTQFYRYKKKTH